MLKYLLSAVFVFVYLCSRKKSTKPQLYPPKVIAACNEIVMQKPDQKFYVKTKRAAAWVCGYLNSARSVCPSSCQFYIVDWLIAGSVGKGTALFNTGVLPDIDLVVFLKNSKPPYKNILDTIGKLLEELDEFSGVIARQYSVEFKIWISGIGDVKVDMVAAEYGVNFDKAIFQTKDDKLSLIDRNKILSCALAEKTVKVIREKVRDPYMLHVVLLAKYWNSLVDMSQFAYIPARSCIIELVAIQAQETAVPIYKSRDLISGFRRFLEKMSRFRELDISVDKEKFSEEEGSESVNLLQLLISILFDTQLDKQKVPEETEVKKKPIIRDPVNATNNFTEGMPLEAMQVWEDQARKTLRVLAQYRNNQLDLGLAKTNEIICALFSHKP